MSNTEMDFADELRSNYSNSDLSDVDNEWSYQTYIQSHTEYLNLTKFLDNSHFITSPGDKNVNIFIPGKKRYLVPPDKIHKFFQLLEACRRKGIKTHFMEKQAEYSGIMLDFDIDHSSNINLLDENKISDMVVTIYQELEKLLPELDDTVDAVVIKSEKPRLKTKPDEEFYRESMHITFPGVICKKSIKLALIKSLIETNAFADAFKDIELKHPDVLDKNSASVPVHFIGSCKIQNGKTPDPLYGVIRVRKSPQRYKDINITKLFENGDVNLCWEFSINFQPIAPIIKRRKYETSDDSKLEEVDTEEHEKFYSDMSTLSIHDHDAAILHKLLGILDVSRIDDYFKGRRVICTLASRESYKPLAMFFSQRAPGKWDKKAFEKLWSDCVIEARSKSYSTGAIFTWAKQDNPVKYMHIMSENAYTYMLSVMYKKGIDGVIGHYQFAYMLKQMVHNKYVVSRIRGEKKPTWYEFILPDDKHQTGQVYKYAASEYPDSLDIYISNGIDVLMEKAFNSIDKRIKEGEHDENHVKMLKSLIKGLSKSRKNINDSNFKKGIIDQCIKLFMNPKFGEEVDTYEEILGVGNGILILGKIPEFIDYHHTYPVTKFTKTNYRPYDPNDPIIQDLERIIRDSYPEEEQDTYEYMMCLYASSLDMSKKPEILTIVKGYGSNCKSTIKDAYTATFGDEFSPSHSYLLLTEKSRDAEKPTPAIMKMEFAHINWYDEIGVDATLLDVNLKRIVGGVITGRKLNEDTKQVSIRGIHIMLTNHDIRVPTKDYGTWRRLKIVNQKISFLMENDPNKPYDPNNKYHKLKDDKVRTKLINDPRYHEAFLSILVKWYSIFATIYGGNINNVPHPTIRKETEEYRCKQDTLTRWINSRVVKCVDPTTLTSIEEFANIYKTWFSQNISDTYKLLLADIISQLKESKLSELKCIDDNQYNTQVKGYRPLAVGSQPEDGELCIGELEPDIYNKLINNFVSVDHRMTMDEWNRHIRSKMHIEPTKRKGFEFQNKPDPFMQLNTDVPKPKKKEYVNAENIDNVLNEIAEM